MFSKEFINSVKEKVDLVELVSEYTKLTESNPYLYLGQCPNPDHKDNRPSFRVWKKGHKSGSNINKYDSWACMVCHSGKKDEKYDNNGSDCISFIMWIEHKDFNGAIMYLCKKYNIDLPDEENDVFYKQNITIATKYVYDLNEKTLLYLHNRGLSDEDILSWGIGYDKISDRIAFPLMDRYKNVLGFSKRAFVDKKGIEKYINSKNDSIFNKGSYLYGMQNFDYNLDNIKITEGQMDVILSTKFGVKNIVATLGTAFTDNHVQIIKHYGKTPIFCMDGDVAGLKSIKRAIDMLSAEGIYSKILLLPNGLDMADLSLKYKDNTEQYILDNSVTYGNFLVQNEINLYTSKITEIKLQFYPRIYEILKKVPEPERNILLNTVKSIFNMEIKMP